MYLPALWTLQNYNTLDTRHFHTSVEVSIGQISPNVPKWFIFVTHWKKPASLTVVGWWPMQTDWEIREKCWSALQHFSLIIEAKDDGGGEWWQLDYCSYKSCKAPVKSSPQTNQHPVFYRLDALPVAQPTVSKHWRVNIMFHGLAYHKLIWGSSNFVSDHW